MMARWLWAPTRPPAPVSRAAKFGGDWFAERYVEGREFNIALLDGQVLLIAEMRFVNWPQNKPRIVGYDAKWEEGHAARLMARCAPSASSAMSLYPGGRVDDHLARKAWRLFDLTGLARVDFRVADGKPLVLEINTNPCISPDAGFAAAAAEAGLDYPALIEAIVRAA